MPLKTKGEDSPSPLIYRQTIIKCNLESVVCRPSTTPGRTSVDFSMRFYHHIFHMLVSKRPFRLFQEYQAEKEAKGSTG